MSTMKLVHEEDIKNAFDALFIEQVKFLQDLVRFSSLRGHEAEI